MMNVSSPVIPMQQGGFPQQQQMSYPQPQQMGYPQQQQQMGYPQPQQQMGYPQQQQMGYPQQQQQQQQQMGYPQQQPQGMGSGQRYALPNTTPVPVVITGYESCGICMPIMMVEPPQVIEFNMSVAGMSFVTSVEDAKRILKTWVSQNCCFGTASATDCVITLDGVCNSFAVEIDTFVEYRQTSQVTVPYARGTPIATPMGAGIAPQAWQMQLPAATFFVDSVSKHEIPFTSVATSDYHCGGDGQVRCEPCGGDGKNRCTHCNGDGKVSRETDGQRHEVQCERCHGSGQLRCHHCGGDGHVKCTRCGGSGMVRNFIEMTRTLKTLKSSEAVDAIPDSELPPALIVAAAGHQMASKTVQSIKPPVGIAPDLDAGMARVKEKAMQQVAQLKAWQHQERLNVKCVPVCRFQATVPGNNKKFHFYIYGTNQQIHCTDYPDTCCWGMCTIA